MNTRELTVALPALLSELVNGSPDPNAETSMLNRGDPGLIGSLERVSADAASRTPAGGAPIAAHVEHLRYGLAFLNTWRPGEPLSLGGADWTLAWKKTSVTESEWRTLRDDLAREARQWIESLRQSRELGERELQWFIGSVAHLAYHLGAIRQIDRATRGPTAEDEVRAKAAEA